MKPRTAILAALLTATAPAAGWAQPAPNEATATFKAGREAMAAGDYQRGLELMRKSYALSKSNGSLVNMARCEAHVGQYGSAMKHFQHALSQLPENDERRLGVAQDVIGISPKVPYLKITLSPKTAPGTAVALDGEGVGAGDLGNDLPVDPGKHEVVASAAGVSRRYEVTLAVGARLTLEVEVGPPPAPPPPPLPPPPVKPVQVGPVAVSKPPPAAPPPAAPANDAEPPATLGWKLGIASLAVGGASLLAGIETWFEAADRQKDLARLCRADRCPASASPTISEYHALGVASPITLAAGAAFLTTGAVLFFTSPRGKVKPPKGPIDPLLGPLTGGGFVGARGVF